MDKSVAIVLVGIGGYGNLYADALLDYADSRSLTFAGAVDPFPEGCRRLSALIERNIPIFKTMEEFFKTKQADLAVISSPIHFHRDQSSLAFANGCNVLCEKPVAASVDEANQMIKAKNDSGGFLAIGYQWSYSRAILNLKKDIMQGRLGKPKKLKTIVLWPRDKSYYSRKWAGRIKDDEGRLILDSVVSNATAHYLHNMFFVLGNEIDRSDYPVLVKAELYRVNDIENLDTAMLYAGMNNGVDLYYYASHAILENYGPIFEYIFENGVVSYNGNEHKSSIKAVLKDGTIIDYGDPNEEPLNKLWASVSAIREKTEIVCPIEAAMPHVICIEGMHRSTNVIEFPLTIKRFDTNSEITWVEGLSALMLQCYADCRLPSEMGISWAKAGSIIRL